MQSDNATFGDTEDFFSRIDFSKVYHEGPIEDCSIIWHRCAEVLAASPLPLDGNLQSIYCRSQPERQMLLEMLGSAAAGIAPLVRVSDDIVVFQKLYSYVEQIGINRDGLFWILNPRKDGQDSQVTVMASDSAGNVVINWGPGPLAGVRRWIIKREMSPGTYRVELHLEGCLAFRGTIKLDDDPF